MYNYTPIWVYIYIYICTHIWDTCVCVCVCINIYRWGGLLLPQGACVRQYAWGACRAVAALLQLWGLACPPYMHQSCCRSVAAVGARMPPAHAPELLQLCFSCGGSHAPHTCTQGACVREYNNSDKAAGKAANILTKLGEFKYNY